MDSSTGSRGELRKFLAPEFIQGSGALDLVGRYALNLGARQVLVVTDPGVRRAGWVERVTCSLGEVGLPWEIFDEVHPNPRTHECMRGVDCFRASASNLIVALGGGSPMDCAKGIAVLASNGGDIRDYEGIDEVRLPGPPLICIPTTAGTAADVSQFAIISNPDEQRKFAIISRKVVPDISLTDPDTLATTDPFLRACSGLDALCHAVEALASNASSSLTDLHAMEAAHLVLRHLPRTLSEEDPADALASMAEASLLAGLAFSNASLGAVHAMAHALGGLLDLPHGLCNALLLPHVIAFNTPEAAQPYARLTARLRLPEGSLPKVLLALNESLGLTQCLGSLGVQRSDFALLAEKALRDPCMVTNPRRPTRSDLESLYAAAF